MANDRLLTDGIDGKGDFVSDALGIDLDPAGFAVEREGHGEDRLQRVALRPAAGRDIGFAARYPNREVENARDHLSRQARAVVHDGDSVRAYADTDLGRDAGF